MPETVFVTSFHCRYKTRFH